MARALDATVPEVYRNFERLVKAELIAKDTDGNYYFKDCWNNAGTFQEDKLKQ